MKDGYPWHECTEAEPLMESTTESRQKGEEPWSWSCKVCGAKGGRARQCAEAIEQALFPASLPLAGIDAAVKV